MESTDIQKRILSYVARKYGIRTEQPLRIHPGRSVLRYRNGKPFVIFMPVARQGLGLSGEGAAMIMNVKAPDILTWDMLIHTPGFLPGYHISRGNWVSVILDEIADDCALFDLVDMSYGAVSGMNRVSFAREPREWLIPSNPEYFDIVHAFDETDIIKWKQ